MSKYNDFALVPTVPSPIEKTEPGAKRILSNMVSDTLAINARSGSFRWATMIGFWK
jgi:hypothetical protein